MTSQVSRREQRERIARERHNEMKVRNGGKCAPGYEGPCMGPTWADYEWADRQLAAGRGPSSGGNGGPDGG